MRSQSQVLMENLQSFGGEVVSPYSQATLHELAVNS